MYTELPSFSEKPRRTLILLSEAAWRMVAISGEFTRREFLIYLGLSTKSTMRALVNHHPVSIRGERLVCMSSIA